MRVLREEVVDAETEADLYFALVKVSNARRDHHLTVEPVEGGLRRPAPRAGQAPIRVLPDYSDLARPGFFIASIDHTAAGHEAGSIAPGDRIVSINDRTVPDYVQAFTPWVVHSSTRGLYWDMARDLPLRPANVPPSMYEDTLRLVLERNGERREILLPYVDDPDLQLPQPEELLYPGFTRVMERLDFNVFLPDDGRRVVLLQWLDFEDELIQDVIDLMAYAEQEGLLDRALIIDVTDSSGGSRGAYAIQRLVSRPFKTTFGNIRLSDAGIDMVDSWVGVKVIDGERKKRFESSIAITHDFRRAAQPQVPLGVLLKRDHRGR